MPQVNRSATHAVEYLHRRGIDYELIDFCIKTGRLYESYPYHNVVFVGMDADGKPRYANQRGIDVFSHGITFRFVGILLADAVHTFNVKYDIACLCGRHGVGERFAFADGKLECICNGSAEFVRNLNLADTLIAVVGERQREGLSFFCRHTLFNCGAQERVDHAENLVGNRCFAFRAIRQEIGNNRGAGNGGTPHRIFVCKHIGNTGLYDDVLNHRLAAADLLIRDGHSGDGRYTAVGYGISEGDNLTRGGLRGADRARGSHRDALRKLGGRIIQRAFHGDRGLSAAGFAIFKPGYIERDGLADERIRHSERRTGEALACSGLDRGACSGEKFAAFIEDPDIRHRGGAVVMDGEGKRHVAGNRK